MCMLKSPNIIAFSMLGSLVVRSSVSSSRKVVFVRCCFGGGWYIPRILIVLFFILTCQIAYSILHRCWALIFPIFMLSLYSRAIPPPLLGLLWVEIAYPDWSRSDWCSQVVSCGVSFSQVSVISVTSMLWVIISWVRKVSLFLIDCTFIVPIMHWVFGLGTMTSEMNMFCRLFLFILFHLSFGICYALILWAFG